MRRFNLLLVLVFMFFTCIQSVEARYYSPVEGRFISEDPIGFNGGDVNLYRYVGNNPINYTDPDGLERTSIDMSIQNALSRGDVVELETILDSAVANEQRAAARTAINRLNSSARDIISKECKGSINREFPSEYANKTIAQIIKDKNSGDAIAKKAWKLINDSRFKK